MCLPQPALTSGGEGEGRRKWASMRVVQALRDFHSPLQLRKKIQRNCSRLGLSEGLRSVTGHATARVQRITRWVFTLNFAKIFVPLLLAAFLTALHPHTEIQLGVVTGIIFFTFAFMLATRTVIPPHSSTPAEEVLPLPAVETVPEHPSAPSLPPAIPSPSLVFLLYQLLPLALLSTLWGWAASLPLPAPFDRLSVWLYATVAKCNVQEAEHSDLGQYKTVSQFFTRRLRCGVRPVCPTSLVVSPADGTLTYSGPVEGQYLQQVKGVRYSLNTFLGVDLPSPPKDSMLALFQAVIYLSPSDYHRFHSPADWTITHRRHFPGRLCSVSPKVVRAFPGLFHINERVVFSGRWHHGFFAMVAVGATNVGSIVADFDPDLKTNQSTGTDYKNKVEYEEPVNFRKGDDFGYFNFGSTIVLLFEAPTNSKLNYLEEVVKVKVGQGMLA